MAYYRTCEFCGVHLDPGERCDCRKDQEPAEADKTGRNRQEPDKKGSDAA